MSLGSDTHQSDMDQHFVPLSFTQSGGSLTIQAPGGGTYAPPGHYMLFILNSNGVPAVASIIRIAASPTAPVRADGVTADRGNGSARRCRGPRPTTAAARSPRYTVTPYIGSARQTRDRGQRQPAADERRRSAG